MLRILIVDDESPLREWINYCLSLKPKQYQIVGLAENAEQACQLIRNEYPHVVITDILMPGMDGLEMVKNMKQDFPDIHYIILTNHAEFHYAKQAMSYGIQEYILKSELRSSDLYAVLDNVEKTILNDDKSHEKLFNNYLLFNLDQTDESLIKPIQEAVQYIHEHYYEPISLTEVANRIHRSPEYFSRQFKNITGENFSVYLTNIRLSHAKKLLVGSEKRITDIAFQVGYQNPSYFSRLYKKHMGITPENERKLGRGKSKL